MNSKTNVIIVLSIMTILLMVPVGWWLWQTKQDKTVSFTSDYTSFKYDSDLMVQTISNQDKKDKYIFRAFQPENVSPFLITLRYEDGIKVVASTSKQEPIDL